MEPNYHIEGIPVYIMLMDEDQANFPAYEMNPDYLTIHETENHDEGADAFMHARYLLNAAYGRQASWHFTVDEDRIVQHARLDQSCWHAGDGSGDGNNNSIGIETCENSDGDFQKTVSNVQALVRYLMGVKNIDSDHIKPHNYWSGKNCPSNILGYWDSFIDGIMDSKAEISQISYKKPEYSTNSIVDYLNKKGMDSSFDARKELAEKYGVDNYRGSADQNLELLEKLRAGRPSRKDDSDYGGNSIVEYLNIIGKDSSFSARKEYAREYGIPDYRGSASQNLELLSLMMQGNKPAENQVDYDGNSIVEYLNLLGKDSSFSNRTRLAERYGIYNYKGTAQQNLELLDLMRGGKKKSIPYPGYHFEVKSPQMRDDNIRMIQKKLNRAINAGLEVDGYYGPNTRSAVIDYQRKYGLKVDGMVGPQTWGHMF